MSELIMVQNSSYGRYEELLLKRDQYAREADSIQIAFTQEFGEIQIELFKEKLACIRLKKTIHYCQASVNRKENIDFLSIRKQIDFDMALYQKELKDMLAKNQQAQESKAASAEDAEQVKKAYHRLAKKLHPDINPKTNETPELMDLWHRVAAAYKSLNLKEITELEVVAKHVMESLNIGTITVNIPDIEDRIQLLEDEINDILTSKPYIYNQILEDESRKEAYRKKLQKELHEMKKYHNTLENVFNDLLAKEGITFTWQMN